MRLIDFDLRKIERIEFIAAGIGAAGLGGALGSAILPAAIGPAGGLATLRGARRRGLLTTAGLARLARGFGSSGSGRLSGDGRGVIGF